MSKELDEILDPLEGPPPLPRRRGSDLMTGLGLLPEQRLKAFSPDQLELVVRHWLHETLSDRYARLRHVAGPGDKGRDVVAFESDENEDPWDNYQCKQYGRKLAPADVWPELCKLVYYASKGDYTVPRSYYFVAPLGCGPKAQDLLKDPETLRRGLIDNWASHGRNLCDLSEIEESINDFSFPKLDTVTGGEIVEDLNDTGIYPVLFGGGLTKPRPADKPPPEEIAKHEMPYVGCLVDAYDDHCDQPVQSSDDALAHEVYGGHLRSSRQDFYCAESLLEFSKDVLVEPDDFESLQQDIYDGVKYTIASSFLSGYERVIAVCEQAATVQISDHPLRSELHPADRSGICHQLANDGRVRWKK